MEIKMINTVAKKRLSVKAQTLATLAAIIAAVALPQIFHLLGAAFGVGTSLGEILLPMHMPVILVGLLAGPYAGAVAGALSPAISFALTGMPVAAALPFMMIELCAYGLFAGLTRTVQLPTSLKVIGVQVAGRIVRLLAILFAVYALGSTAMTAASVWNGVVKGIIGIGLQIVLLPLAVKCVEHFSERND